MLSLSNISYMQELIAELIYNDVIKALTSLSRLSYSGTAPSPVNACHAHNGVSGHNINLIVELSGPLRYCPVLVNGTLLLVAALQRCVREHARKNSDTIT